MRKIGVKYDSKLKDFCQLYLKLQHHIIIVAVSENHLDLNSGPGSLHCAVGIA